MMICSGILVIKFSADLTLALIPKSVLRYCTNNPNLNDTLVSGFGNAVSCTRGLTWNSLRADENPNIPVGRNRMDALILCSL